MTPNILMLPLFGFSLPDNTFVTLTGVELRAKHVKVQYRILYFVHGQNVVVLSNAFVKAGNQVPDEDIDLALRYKELFVLNPKLHTYVEPEEETDE